MGILNRRNAFLGWVAWQAGKRVAKRKARGALRRQSSGGSSWPKGATATVLAALGGAFWFWRRRSDDADE